MRLGARIGIGVVALAAVVGVMIFARRWREFSPEGGGFTVAAPADFAERTRPFSMSWGHDSRKIYEAQRTSFEFSVGCVDLPPEGRNRLSPEAALDDLIRAIRSDAGDPGDAGNVEAITLGAHSGCEFSMEASRDGRPRKTRARAWIVMSSRKLYFITVGAASELMEKGHDDRYLESFRILE